MSYCFRTVGLLIAITLVSNLHAQFDINFEFVDGTQQQRAEVQEILNQSKLFWENILEGYQPGIRLTGADIEVTLTLVTGPNALGGHLLSGGSINQVAGFSFYTNSMGSRSVGVLAINPDLVNNPAIQTASNHEIAHILGFGTLWEANKLYANGSGEYVGPFGLNSFQMEFDPTATFVPIQLGQFGANVHYPESANVVDQFGRPIANALMTGFVEADPADTFFSQTSGGIFVDLGYRLKKDTILLGDINLDGQVSLLDVAPFVTLLTDGKFQVEADVNLDDAVNLLDVAPFVDLLAGG